MCVTSIRACVVERPRSAPNCFASNLFVTLRKYPSADQWFEVFCSELELVRSVSNHLWTVFGGTCFWYGHNVSSLPKAWHTRLHWLMHWICGILVQRQRMQNSRKNSVRDDHVVGTWRFTNFDTRDSFIEHFKRLYIAYSNGKSIRFIWIYRQIKVSDRSILPP